jgi:hypothetical protein
MVMFCALFAMLAAGFCLERVTVRMRIAQALTRGQSASDSAYLGMKHAEDWLITAAMSAVLPTARKNSSDPDPLKRIEVVKNDGTPIPAGLFAPGVELYVADADYEPGLFTGSLANKAATPFIPRMPPVETEAALCRFYYLRSSATGADGITAIDEQLLSVSRDKFFGGTAVERIYYRKNYK